MASHTLAGLPCCSSSPAASELPPLLLIDTAGCEFEEAQEADGDSTFNEGEARTALAHVKRLLAAGLAPADVGVITPYSAQVRLVCSRGLLCAGLAPAATHAAACRTIRSDLSCCPPRLAACHAALACCAPSPAPHCVQVALLKELRGERLAGLEVSTVDGFQGREKEAIVISMVRRHVAMSGSSTPAAMRCS